MVPGKFFALTANISLEILGMKFANDLNDVAILAEHSNELG